VSMTSTDLVERQEQTTFVSTAETAAEMRARLQEMRQKVSLVQSFFKEIMRPNEDYGIIPGTDKPTLLKSGAEKLCEFYGYSIHVETEREEKDRATGWYDCAVKVTLISRRTGEVIAEGVGEANTYEARYRYRWVWEEQVPPDLDKDSLPSRKTRNGRIQYRLENDDLFSLWNTVKKMAKKRALIDATLSATRSSGLFTQDMEDLREWADAGETIEAEYRMVHDDEPPERSAASRPAQQGDRPSASQRESGGASRPFKRLTDRQIKRLYAIASKAKVNAQDVARALYRHGVDGLTREEYDELCAALEAGEIRKLLRTRIYMRARDAGYTDDAIKAELMAAAGHESLMAATTDDLLKLSARLAIPEEPEAQQPPAEAVTA